MQAFPGPGAKIQVSADGGTDPVRKRTGGEIYFRNGDKMMAVSVSTAPTLTIGRPQMLWEGRYSHGMSASCGPAGATSSNYDVTPDGARFLMVKDEAPDKAVSKQFVVVLGWADGRDESLLVGQVHHHQSIVSICAAPDNILIAIDRGEPQCAAGTLHAVANA